MRARRMGWSNSCNRRLHDHCRAGRAKQLLSAIALRLNVRGLALREPFAAFIAIKKFQITALA